jgi:hypothetical protein
LNQNVCRIQKLPAATEPGWIEAEPDAASEYQGCLRIARKLD